MGFGKGTVHPAEARELRDSHTGARLVQVTAHDSINHHLYPLACSTTPDMRWVIFASSRSGAWQFFKARFPLGEIVQLTDLPGGVHGYSGHLTPDGGELLYTAQGEIHGVDLETLQERTLAAWPGASLGEVNLSHNGEWLVTAAKWNGRNYLAVGDAAGSKAELILECERTIIHPQFHPQDDSLIEYAQDPAPRVWIVRRDGSGNTCVYDHGNEEFIVHETWLGVNGELILVHWPFALKRIRVSELSASTASERPTASTVASFNAWHIGPNERGTAVLCDTNHPDTGIWLVEVASGEKSLVCWPGASCRGSQWRESRYATKQDFERAGKDDSVLSWMEARGDTVYGPQWTHPHPSWSADEHWCVFDSDRTSMTQVYAAELAETGASPP